jgi:hypothetical protein
MNYNSHYSSAVLEHEEESSTDESDNVSEDMNALLAINPIVKEKLRKINGTNTYANSVNVYVGRPRSGKTFQALHDIIAVLRNDSNVHMLIYINESGEIDDDTFERFQELITVPILFVKYKDAEKCLRSILDYKIIYNKIKNNCAEREVPTHVRDEIFDNLHINSFDRDFLHTLILTEDATNAKIIKQADSYINDLLTRCAHTQFSFFILIHYWKALTTNIKANLSTIYIFGGYSRQQLSYMLYQMNIPITMKELMNQYSKMGQFRKLVIDCNLGDYGFC